MTDQPTQAMAALTYRDDLDVALTNLSRELATQAQRPMTSDVAYTVHRLASALESVDRVLHRP